jgi:hypothetical protein
MKQAQHATNVEHSTIESKGKIPQKVSTDNSSLVPENLGWLDRLLRFIAGTALISVSATYLFLSTTTPTWLNESEPMAWPYFLMIIAIYPIVSAILGRDPIYSILGVRSCGNSPKNPCGSFPFELDAAMGNKPIPDSEIEHSLSTSHHEHKGHPKSHTKR